MNTFDPSRPFAESMDRIDPLSRFRSEFPLASSCIYLDGNSLGLLSHRAEESLQSILDSWRHYGIDGWSEGPHAWFGLSEQLGAAMAPLIGADADEVIITGSTTANLHQLVSTFYHPTPQRYKILADSLTFPSDIYALQSQLQLHGYNPEHALIQVPSRDGMTLEEDDIIGAMAEDVALIVLPSVLYVSGQWLDMPRLATAARDRGIMIGFDLAHSVGVMPHHLKDWDVDFAFWCTYKYLNGGPGSTGGLYVARRHFSTRPGLAGWFSSEKRGQFDLSHTLVPAADVGAYQIGTPHVLSMAPLTGSLSMFSEVGIESIRQKSLQASRYLMDLVSVRLAKHGLSLATPADDAKRGGHVALVHPDAVRICKALKARRVIPDYRPPQVIRLAPSPLYTSYCDLWNAVEQLRLIMEHGEYAQYSGTREVIA